MPILPQVRDPRLITVRRGGSLTDSDHRMLAEWAVACATRVLPLFEHEQPSDRRPHEALDVARQWIAGSVPMKIAHAAAFTANAAGRGLPDAPRFAALAVGQAVAVAHVAAHDLGAAAYAIRAVAAARDTSAGREERDWQRSILPDSVRELVLSDQAARDSICWGVFSN